MSVSLQKGQKVSLTKDNAGLSSVMVGLGCCLPGRAISQNQKVVDIVGSVVLKLLILLIN